MLQLDEMSQKVTCLNLDAIEFFSQNICLKVIKQSSRCVSDCWKRGRFQTPIKYLSYIVCPGYWSDRVILHPC